MNLSEVFFPKQEEAFKLVFGGITGILNCVLALFGGAIRGGKTVWGLKTLLFLCEVYPGSRWAVVRADHERIRQNTIPSFEKIREDYGILSSKPYAYTHPNGSIILFISENFARDKELNAFKGLEVNGFLLEEINELKQKTLNKCFERAGAWIIPGLKVQPKPVIMGTCNPTQGWVKEKIHDRWKNGTLPEGWHYISSKITDNPHIPESYKKSLLNLPQYEYEVFVNGNWDISLKTGNEFFRSFEIDQHVAPVQYNDETTVHISIDNNRLPYIAVQIWQIYPDDKKVIQIDEIPCKDPHNTAKQAGIKAREYLDSISYDNTVYLYGDATTKAGNTIDEQKRSFYQIFEEEINEKYYAVDRMPKSNPPVAASGEFVNALYENWDGWQIIIGEHCKTSISDYIDTKTEKDGTMLKERIKDPELNASYEVNGHFSDCKRCFITEILTDVFHEWKNRFSEPEKYETIKIFQRNMR